MPTSVLSGFIDNDLKKLDDDTLETFAKVFIVNEVQGARNAEAEIVRGVQRGYEYRATQ
ncbi:MAG: hypothetical protein HOP21_00015 [Methylotenera sp.]|nr:hypothetical protein [Methylotenera sp.]